MCNMGYMMQNLCYLNKYRMDAFISFKIEY